MATPTNDAGPARRRRTPESQVPPPTVVLFVRHGTTPTTGQELPGRAPGLHLSETGKTQAQAVAERLAEWSDQAGAGSHGIRHTSAGAGTSRQAAPDQGTDGRVARRGPSNRSARPPIVAVFASPLERTVETATPIAKQLGLPLRRERRLLECDFGSWTGTKLADLSKLAAWNAVQRYPSGFRFPGGESFVEVQARMIEVVASWQEAFPGQAVVAVSHADPIKAAVAHALGTHLDLFQRITISPCSLTAIAYGATGPTVLTTNATSSVAELRPS